MAIPKHKPQEPEPAPQHDPDQAWFWSKRWQQGEKEVEEHIRRGEVEDFDTMDEFLSSLDDDPAQLASLEHLDEPKLRAEMKALEEASIADLTDWGAQCGTALISDR